MSKSLVRHKVPGVSVAVIENGSVNWVQGYGFVEAGSERRVTPETLFQAASISKPVAAMAALHMMQYGNFTLDEDVNLKLKTWKVPENEFTREKKVTLRGLLSHTAGLTVHGFPGYESGAELPPVPQILDGVKPANTAAVRVDIVPGSKWRYSGGGYTVMQLLLVDRFGRPFPELMRRIVIDRIGMKHSTYEQPLPASRFSMAATAHDNNGKPIAGKWHTYPEMAAAGLWTTPGDLAVFALEVANASVGKSSRVIERSTAREMLTRQSGDYGLGFGIEGEGDAARFAHGGSNGGFRCMLICYRDGSRGAIVMTNSDNGSAVIREVIDHIAATQGWPGYGKR